MEGLILFRYNLFMGFFITILMLNFIIFIHELGHLIFAKIGKIGVFEFSIGMGPKLFGLKYKATSYNVRLLPIGGFVKLAGMDDAEDKIDKKYFFQNASLFTRFKTLFAGSFFNIILGFLIFFFILLFLGKPKVTSTVESVLLDSPAYVQGIKPGDKLISLNDQIINDVATDFVMKVQNSQDSLKLNINRNGEPVEVLITPFFDQEHNVNRLGVQLKVDRYKLGVFSTIYEAVSMTKYSITQVFANLKMLFSGTVDLKELSGPVGIVQFASHQFNQNVTQFFSVMAFISIMLGVINLFPIPVLDGGHILFLLFEMIFKKPIPKKALVVINNVFVLCLLFLMVFILFNDIFYWGERTEIIKEILDK